MRARVWELYGRPYISLHRNSKVLGSGGVMADIVLVPLPGIGTLELPRAVFEASLRPFGTLGAPAAPTQPEPLLDAAELAQALNLPKSCVYERARRGDFPSVRVGKHLRFRRSEVLEALGASAKGAVVRG